MKSYIVRLYGVVAAIAIVLSILAILYSQSSNKKNNQITTIIHTIYSKENLSNSNRDSLKNELVNLQFEKEAYINQLSLLSDWVILFVTILFAVFGFVGTTFFIAHINSVKEECMNYTNSETNNNRNEIIEQNIEIDKHKNEFKELKKVVYNGEGNASFIISDYFANHNDFLQSALFALLAAKNFKQASLLEGQAKIIVNGVTANNLKIALEQLNRLEKDHLSMYIRSTENMPYDIILKRIHEILDELFIHNDEHLTKLAALIKAKLMNIEDKI